jgi:hypothetical protein
VASAVAGDAAGFKVGAPRTGLVRVTDLFALIRSVRFLVATFLDFVFSFPPARFLAVVFRAAVLGRALAAGVVARFLARIFAFAFVFALPLGLADRLIFVALAIATLPA